MSIQAQADTQHTGPHCGGILDPNAAYPPLDTSDELGEGDRVHLREDGTVVIETVGCFYTAPSVMLVTTSAEAATVRFELPVSRRLVQVTDGPYVVDTIYVEGTSFEYELDPGVAFGFALIEDGEYREVKPVITIKTSNPDPD